MSLRTQNDPDFQKDWHAILGVPLGAPVEEIEKAARKLSAKFHPDKNLSAPNIDEINEKFLLIQQSKEVLLDETRRVKIETYLTEKRKRKEYDSKKFEEMNAKRKKFKQQLEENLEREKDRTSATNHQTPTPSREPDRDPKQKLEELRRENQALLEKMQRDRERDVQKSKTASTPPSSATTTSGPSPETLFYLKLKWKKSLAFSNSDILAYLDKNLTQTPFHSIHFYMSKASSAILSFSTKVSLSVALHFFSDINDFKASEIKFSEFLTASSSFDEETNTQINSKRQGSGTSRQVPVSSSSPLDLLSSILPSGSNVYNSISSFLQQFQSATPQEAEDRQKSLLLFLGSD